jgi:mRNA interferase MazF
MTAQTIRRGSIYLVDLGTHEDAMDADSNHPKKRRPALVVQNDLGNQSADTIVVVALSSRIPSRQYPFHVDLPPEILGKAGVVMCEQIWTVERRRIESAVVAVCPPELMREVDDALRCSLGLS